MSWEFTGDVSYICSNCNQETSTPIGDFDIDNYGGEERSMGAENLIKVSYDFPCDKCDNEISISFDVSEYPLGSINFITENHEGAEVLNTPETKDIDDPD